MVPNIVTRSMSNDQFYLDSIFYNNKYKLKGQKDSQKVILDIGGHTGFFAFTALLLGARKVYSFEPFLDNYSILLQNIYNSHFTGRITTYQIGVYVNKITGLFSTPELVSKIYFDFGGISLVNNKDTNHYPCPCVTLDEILGTYCYGEKIDILKININGTEKEILLSSNLLSTNVESICGEVELDERQVIEFKKDLGIRGFIQWYSLPPNVENRIVFFASKNALSDNFNIQ